MIAAPISFLGPPLRSLRKTQGYSDTHKAIDYVASPGTPALATISGKVVGVTGSGNCGIGLAIQRGTRRVRYCHFSSLAVVEGESVRRGDTVGYTGATGHVTGPHLHYAMGVRCNGSDCTIVNPEVELAVQQTVGWALTIGAGLALAASTYFAGRALLQ